MTCPFFTALSPIAGRGLFANRYFPCGTPLLKVSDSNGKLTSMGSLINIAPSNGVLALRTGANIVLHHESDGCYAVSSVPIFQGREILAPRLCK